MNRLCLFLIFLIPCGLWASEAEKPQALPKIEAQLSGSQLKLMVAHTEKEKSQGLMFYDFIEANQGMLFVYNNPQILSFWMCNTKIPLDIVFFSENLQVVDMISSMQPGYGKNASSLPIYKSSVEAQYALELKSGAIKTLNIRLGDSLIIPLAALYSSD